MIPLVSYLFSRSEQKDEFDKIMATDAGRIKKLNELKNVVIQAHSDLVEAQPSLFPGHRTENLSQAVEDILSTREALEMIDNKISSEELLKRWEVLEEQSDSLEAEIAKCERLIEETHQMSERLEADMTERKKQSEALNSAQAALSGLPQN